MNFIIDFYKSLETLDLIIFWGIIIVIILLLIFSLIMINKNEKFKKIINKKHEKKDSNNNEELPIKKDNIETSINSEINIDNELETEKEIILPEIPQIQNDENNNEQYETLIEYEIKFEGVDETRIKLLKDYMEYIEYLSKWNGELPDTIVGEGVEIILPGNN